MTLSREIWRNVFAAIFAIFIFAPLLWFVLDREPPYMRLNGVIDPPVPKPEDWIKVVWQIHPLRNDCRPIGPRGLTRTIIDGAGQVIDIDPVDTLYDGGSSPIVRSFQLPRGATPGHSRYRASACFACGHNPLHYLWPICVDKPEISFDIGKP